LNGTARVTARHITVRPGLYRDSVRLMQISQTLGGLPGVRGCLIAMATGLNLELLSGMGFDPPQGAGPNDMLVALAADEEPALAAALTEGVPYVALVASPRRGAAVRAALDVPEALKARLRTPAGLDIGARTAPEIALSILAEIVQERRSGAPRGTPVPGVPVEVPAAHAGDCCHHDHGG